MLEERDVDDHPMKILRARRPARWPRRVVAVVVGIVALAVSGSGLGAQQDLGAVTLTSPVLHASPGDRVDLHLEAELDGEPYQLIVYQPEGHREPYRVRARRPDGSELELPEASVHYLSLTPNVVTMDGRGQVRVRETGVGVLQARVFLGDVIRTAQVRIGVPEELLTEDHFVFDGPFGSYGSRVEQVGENHFVFHSGSHPLDSGRNSGLNFSIPSGFRGNTLILDASGGMPSRGHNYNRAYSFDGLNWTPILQEEREDGGIRFVVPASEADALHFGGQIPLAYETGRHLVRKWATDPATREYVTVHEVGLSVQGRKLIRVEITDPDSPYAREDRWVHYISSSHPHEGKARWRVVGGVEWLLSDEGADARQRHIWHFVVMVNPDGVNNGWSRMGMENIDSNRTFRVGGPDRSEQSKEGYIFQNDVDSLVRGDPPLTTYWDWHVWWGPVEPMFHPGPEFGSGPDQLGEWTEFRDLIERNDVDDLILPLAVRDPEGGTTVWDRGVHVEYGITASLTEGGGELDTQEENMEAGAVLVKSISEFYRGTRAAF